MKRFYIITIIITLCLLAVFCFNKIHSVDKEANAINIKSKNTIILDAGHGGKDAGTVGIDGTAEKDINLQIVLTLHDYLMVCGIDTLAVREGDYEFYPEGTDTSRSDLYNRLDFVNSVPDAVLISIHQNHFEDEREHGTQIWYSANNAQSKRLADSILTNVKQLLQPNNTRENKESDDSYYMLYQATVPSIMVECGFMSNSEENSKLKNIQYQNDMAYAILTGICGEV